MAHDLSIPQQSVNKYALNKAEPNIDTLCKIADYLHISMDELLGRKSNNINLEVVEPETKSLIVKILSMNKVQRAQTINFVNTLTMFDEIN